MNSTEKMQQEFRQQLANLIFQQLPIEFIVPEKRHVADVSADADNVSLLLAGFERLRTAVDIEFDLLYVHGFAHVIAHGIASDAAHAQKKRAQLPQTAKAEQIMIDHDLLCSWKWLEDTYPQIIVGVIDDASALEHVLKYVGLAGYIGLLVPRTLMDCSLDVLRQTTFVDYDLLELWTISDDTHTQEFQSHVVVLAQRKYKEDIPAWTPIRVRHLPSPNQLLQSSERDIWEKVPSGLLFTEHDWDAWLSGRLPHQLPAADRTWMQPRQIWETTGIVDRVSMVPPSVTFWMDGFDDAIEALPTVPIVSSMPGWMLRPATPFVTQIPREDRKQWAFAEGTRAWGYFQAQPYMYLTEEEILENIDKTFSHEEDRGI